MSYIGGEEEVDGTGTSGQRSGANSQEPRLTIKWTDPAINRLCAAIKPYVFMYDYDHPQNKDRALKKRTWIAIAKNTGIVTEPRHVLLFARECEKKFKNLRDELIKTMKRPTRKTDKPYKHADKLAFLNIEQLLSEKASQLFYLEDGHETMDHDYNYEQDAQMVESAYAAASVAADGPIVAFDDMLYEESPLRSTGSSASKKVTMKRPASDHNSVHRFLRSTLRNEPIMEIRQQKQILPPKRTEERQDDSDELDDFSNMLVKRLRRLPNDCWGHAMSRLMDTLSSVEGNLKKKAVSTSSAQTDA